MIEQHFKELNELILSNTLLRPKQTVISNYQDVITDFDQFWYVYNNIDDGFTVLDSVKGNEAGNIFPNNMTDKEFQIQRKILSKKSSDEFHKIKKYIPEQYKELAEEIEADFSYYIEGKFFGIPTLFDEIIEIYKLGCMPCGWKGEYPEGHFIVFCPESTK